MMSLAPGPVPSRTAPTQTQRSYCIDANFVGDCYDPSPSPAVAGTPRTYGSPPCWRPLFGELGPPGLEDLSLFVREDAPPDPPLQSTAEPGDLVGKDVSRTHDKSPPLDRQKTRHRL